MKERRGRRREEREEGRKVGVEDAVCGEGSVSTKAGKVSVGMTDLLLAAVLSSTTPNPLTHVPYKVVVSPPNPSLCESTVYPIPVT